jgi:hypothetical protein
MTPRPQFSDFEQDFRREGEGRLQGQQLSQEKGTHFTHQSLPVHQALLFALLQLNYCQNPEGNAHKGYMPALDRQSHLRRV